MHYTYGYSNSDSMKFQGKKSEALKVARKNNMYIKEERNGNFVLARNVESVIYEHDEDKVTRQCNPWPYLESTHPEYKEISEKRVQLLVESLNAGLEVFDDVCKAAS